MRTCEQLRALGFLADEMRGRRQGFEIDGLQRLCAIRG
jgi:hypothetical protein